MRGALRSLCVLAVLVGSVSCGDEEGGSDPSTHTHDGGQGMDEPGHEEHPQGDGGDTSHLRDAGQSESPTGDGGSNPVRSHSSRVRFSWQGV